MGIFSWFGSRKQAGKHRARRDSGPDTDTDTGVPDLPPSLVRTRYETPEQEAMDEAVEEDLARLEEDDKYFGAEERRDDML